MAKNLPIYMEETTVLSEDEKLAQETKAAEAAAAKEEKTVYQKELERLTAEKEAAETEAKKQEDIARQKTGALKDEKEKSKAAEAAAEALAEAAKFSQQDLDKRLDERFANEKFNTLLLQNTSDPDEQALIKLHYETSIVKTGNVETDLARAVAIANSHLVEQARQAQIEREENEARTVSFQGGQPNKGRPIKPAYETNPTLRAAANFLDKLGMGGAKKYLGK